MLTYRCITVEEQGDDLKALHDDEVLVVSNHLSTGDTPLLMFMLQRHGTVGNNMYWIMWHWFKWLQFGWVSRRTLGQQPAERECGVIGDH